jgi:phage terminase large subunit-like protein
MLPFLQAVWWGRKALLIGRHTQAIADELTAACDALLRGESTFLLIAVPFRHGKSDLVSRAFPAFVLGRLSELNPDMIMSGYGDSLVRGFSRDVKRIIRSPAYRAIFPNITLERGANRYDSWSVSGSTGVVTATGLGGSITGKGGDVIILDDYCRKREEAVSLVYRDKVWESFQADLMTRRAPASIVIVCATPWHVDDLRGRIKKEMRENPDFPQFKDIRFPAKNADGSWLFPERFPGKWYLTQYAALKKQAAGMLDCDPQVEGGNRFTVDGVKFHNNPAEFPATRFIRCWDLASSAKERDKDDPDWTVGILLAVTYVSRVPHLWIKDIVAIQAEAPRRDALIQATARAESGVTQHVEAYGGYKDAYTTLKNVLNGICVVKPSHLPADKSAKAAPLEPLFDAGNVHLMRASWNETLLRQFREFPEGSHDDYVDPVAIGFHELAVARGNGMAIPEA